MLNGGGGGRLENWHLKGLSEIMCVFLAETSQDEKLLRDLIRDVNNIDRILGNKIGFLVLFERKASDDVDDNTDFRSLADILSNYKIDQIAKDHLSADNIESLRNRFGMTPDLLPAILVFVRGLPNDPFIYRCPKNITKESLLDWFTGLKKITEKYENRHPVVSIEHLSSVVSSVEQKEIQLTAQTQRFSNALTHLANKYHLSREHQWLIAYLPKTEGTLHENLERALGRIDAERSEITLSPLSADKQMTQIKFLAQKIDKMALTKSNDLLQVVGGNFTSLDDLLIFEEAKYADLLSEIEEFSRDTRITHNLASLASQINLGSWKTRLNYITRLVLRAKELAGLVTG